MNLSLALSIALGYVLGKLGWRATLVAWAYVRIVVRAAWNLRRSYDREYFRAAYASWHNDPSVRRYNASARYSAAWYAVHAVGTR